MSAGDYYGTYNPYDPLDRNPSLQSRREDAPLPPVPKSDASPRPTKPSVNTTAVVSPVSSPFEEDSYSSYPSYPSRPSQPQPSTAPDYLYSRDAHQKPYSDPFADPSAISLQSQSTQKPGFHTNGSPIEGRDMENNYLRRDSDPKRRGRRRQRPAGPWWKQKIAWFVWTMTTIQVVVFIIEIIRACKF